MRTGGARDSHRFDCHFARVLGTGQHRLSSHSTKSLILVTVLGTEAKQTAQCEVRWWGVLLLRSRMGWGGVGWGNQSSFQNPHIP